MKQFIKTLLFLLLPIFAFSQAKQFYLVEHFTNSRCGICGASNPAFYAQLNKYPQNVHHVSIHPSYPYTSCIFYAANKTENQARFDYYNANATPQYAINGSFKGSTGDFSENTIKTLGTSNLQMSVSETGTTSRTITVKVKELSTTAKATPYLLHVWFVEKQVDYAAPNGEKVHYDVFRKALTASAGQSLSLAPNEEKTLTFTITTDAAWKQDQMYALAFVQDATTKAVYNSGTKFDALTSSINESADLEAIKIYQNPTADNLNVELKDLSFKPSVIQVLNLLGQTLEKQTISTENMYSFNLANYAQGVYLLQVRDDKNNMVTKQIIKQ